MAFQQTMAMSSPMDGATPAPGGGFGGAPGTPPPGGGFGAPAGAPPGGGFGAPQSPAAGGGFGAPPSQPQQGFGGPAAAPEKKKKSPLIYVAIGCGALLALSCIASNLWYFLLAPDADDVADVLEDAAEEAAGSAICARAVDCCEAYVNEMTAAGTPGLDAASTCAGLRMAGVMDATCQTTIDGYRQGLEAMSRTVPASCQ